jgi:hypothetical protein
LTVFKHFTVLLYLFDTALLQSALAKQKAKSVPVGAGMMKLLPVARCLLVFTKMMSCRFGGRMRGAFSSLVVCLVGWHKKCIFSPVPIF